MNPLTLDPAVRSTLVTRLQQAGYAFVSRDELQPLFGSSAARLDGLSGAWDGLPRDLYLRDGGRYRSRRHTCYLQEFPGVPDQSRPGSSLSIAPHRAHWQPTSYNALHGGIERWFEPIAPEVVRADAWQQLIRSVGDVLAQVRPVGQWFIEAHQFRIDTESGIGRPTPEGAHRDGVDFVALFLVQRRNVRGGETRVFDARGTTGIRFTMEEPWSLLLMDDERVIHETTPIQPDGEHGVRDTLVLTYRARGFQSPDSA